MDPVSSVGRRNRLPTETGSCSSNADITGENLLLNSNSPVKSPPYSSAESDDNSFKGTGKCNYFKNFILSRYKYEKFNHNFNSNKSPSAKVTTYSDCNPRNGPYNCSPFYQNV